jgi:hypothetical protein
MTNVIRAETKKAVEQILAAKEKACAEISNMLPRFRELMAEQEAAKRQIKVEDDRRFSKIVDVEIAKLESVITSIRYEQINLANWIERLEKRKKKK